jgi:hypothetical protein
MKSDLVVVGVVARVDTKDSTGVRRRLETIEGVETFDLPVPEKLGILIEARGIDAAHRRLCDEVDQTDGVLGTWPVALEIDDSEVDGDANAAVPCHESSGSRG